MRASLHSIAKQPLPEQEPIGLLVAAVRRRYKQAVTALVRGRRLSPQQFWTVVAIAKRPGASLGELAARRRMDEPTACRVVDGLVRRRLVRKAVDAADQRRRHLVLTAAGEQLAAQLLPIAAEISSAAEQGLTRTERQAVAAGLARVLANLDRYAEGARARPQPPSRPPRAAS